MHESSVVISVSSFWVNDNKVLRFLCMNKPIVAIWSLTKVPDTSVRGVC